MNASGRQTKVFEIVQNLLSTSEKCKIVTEVRKKNHKGEEEQRFLALIENATAPTETAIFGIKQAPTGSYVIKDIVPIYGNLRLVKKSKVFYEFSYTAPGSGSAASAQGPQQAAPDNVFVVEATEPETIDDFIKMVLDDYRRARQAGLMSWGMSHQWVKRYIVRPSSGSGSGSGSGSQSILSKAQPAPPSSTAAASSSSASSVSAPPAAASTVRPPPPPVGAQPVQAPRVPSAGRLPSAAAGSQPRPAGRGGGSGAPSPLSLSSRRMRPPTLSSSLDKSGSRGQAANIKEYQISQMLKQRESEFMEVKSVSVFVGSWNVNGKQPQPNVLGDWLAEPHTVALPPDVFALGFQELDLSAANFMTGVSPLESAWEKEIVYTLSRLGPKYHMVASKRLVGMLIFVFVRESLRPHVADVQVADAATGIMNIMGNKGGVAVRMKIHDTTVCFVNSHLAAHTENVSRRNQDYQTIARTIAFLDTASTDGGLGGVLPTYGVFDHDYVIWFGDLNYRFTNLKSGDAKALIQARQWNKLYEYDQLRQQIASQAAFENFVEGALNFPPGYKFDVGTQTYDTSEKQRCPAWCDRVLFWSDAQWSGSGLGVQRYNTHPSLVISDHKPVSALVIVKVRASKPAERMAIYRELVRDLDRLENDSRPMTQMSPFEVNFADCKYLVPVTQFVELKNVGISPARFEFVPAPPSNDVCPSWLWIQPMAGVVLPGQAVSISITAEVGNDNAFEFNSGAKKIDSQPVLVLHVDNGADHFVVIKGSYLPSCFGNPLSYLVRFLGPIRDGKPEPENSSKCLSLPKELWRILDFLYKHGIDEPGLFTNAGGREQLEQIRDCLDTGTAFDDFQFDVDSMAETLLLFIESLRDSLIPNALVPSVLACTTYEQCAALVQRLPPVNRTSFQYVVAFLREVLSLSTVNKLTIDQIALVFARVIFPMDDRSGDLTRKMDFIKQFLRPENELKLG